MMILSFSILVPQVRYLSGTGECVCVYVCVCVCVCACVCACVCVERVERLETLHVVPSYIAQYCLFYDHTHVHEDAW